MPTLFDTPPEPLVATTENAPALRPPVPTAVPAPTTPPRADPFAGLEEVSPETIAAADLFAGLESANDPFAGLEPADALDVRSVEELDADRATFNPREYYASNPDVARDPKKLEKLLEVYRRRDKEGLKAGEVVKAAATEALPTVGNIFKGLRDLTAGAIEAGLQPAVNALGSVVTGDIFDPQMRRELAATTARGQRKALAESSAAAELSASSLADLARQGIQKLPKPTGDLSNEDLTLEEAIHGRPKPEKTDQELLRQLAADVEFSKQLETVAEGRGEAAKAAGLDADALAAQGVTLNPEVIQRLSLVDPLTLVATAGTFKVLTSAGNVVLSATTRAAAENAIGKLLAKTATAPARALGKTIEATGKAAEKVAPLAPAAGVTAGALAGDLTLAGGYFTGKAAQRTLPIIGGAAERTGRAITKAANTVANSTTFQKALTGAAEGAVAAAPFAAASSDDQTAGAILGAGITLGAGARGVPAAAEAPARAISGRKLAPGDFAFPKTESKPYGISAALDNAHAEAIKALPEAARNEINSFREATRDLGGEVYVLDQDVFTQSLFENAERTKGEPLTGPELRAVQELADTHGYFDLTLPGPEGKTRRAVVLNSSAQAATHEVGHLFHALLSPERNAELVQAARDSYTPEQIASYKANYEQRLGRTVTEDYVLNEIVAENFSQLFRNTPLRNLPTPPSLSQKIGRAVTDFAEQAGLDLTAGVTTSEGVPSSLRFNEVVRDAAREILTPRPDAPTAVAPTARSAPKPEPVSLSEAAQTLGDLVEPRDIPAEVVYARDPRRARPAPAPETEPAAPTPEPEIPAAATEARAIAAEAPATPEVRGTASPRELLGQIAESIATGEGVKLNYLSAPDEPAASISSNRAIRRDVVEAFRNMPAEKRPLWEKLFFPDKVIKTKGGKYQVQGWAPEVFASNAHKFAKFVSETPEAARLNPYYKVDPKTGSFTADAWQNLYDDVLTAVNNYTRGATASGEPLVVPRSVTEAGGYAPKVRPGVRPLEQGRADIINMLFGFKLPETPRLQRGKPSLNILGQEVSEATIPGRTSMPSRPRGVFTGEEAARQGIEGRQILEINPLRKQFEEAAQAAGKPMPSFIEAIQKLNLENIKDVTPTPETPEFRANTLTLSAGFQPRDWRVSGVKRGEKAETVVRAEDIAEARKLAEAQGFGKINRVESADKLANDVAFQPRDWRVSGVKRGEKSEVIVRAEDIAEARKLAEAQGISKITRVESADKLANDAAFQALTERGASAESLGFEVRDSGPSFTQPAVSLYKDNKLAGTITARLVSPTEAEITNVFVDPGFRGQKLSEVLYRELGVRLRDSGVESLVGMTVHPGALKSRQNVFPETKVRDEYSINDEMYQDVQSRITPESRF